jgi:hypothetical protein
MDAQLAARQTPPDEFVPVHLEYFAGSYLSHNQRKLPSSSMWLADERSNKESADSSSSMERYHP